MTGRRIISTAVSLCFLIGCGTDEPVDPGSAVDFMMGGATMTRYMDAMNAEAELITQTCMREQGFEYTVRRVAAEDFTDQVDVPEGEYGIVESLGASPLEPTPGVESGDLSDAFHEQYQAALNESGGCLDRGYTEARELYAFDQLAAVEVEIEKAIEAWQQSAEITAYLDEWRSCMAASGFRLSSSTELVDLVTETWFEDQRNGSSTARTLERRLFLAESGCPEGPGLDPDQLFVQLSPEANAAIFSALERLREQTGHPG